MENQSKLILKGIAIDGTPFTKEIHSLDEVKSSGNYTVVCKNATVDNGLPQISGKKHLCFCCEAQLNVTCCYSDDEAQSSTAYGQALTICDRETGTTNCYTRTITPGLNSGKWSLWQMAATGDIEVISQNSSINTAISNLASRLDSESTRATARQYNYIGNYPFSQKVIDAGADKMIITGYIDIEYDEEKAYCFSVAIKNSSTNRIILYRKDKDLQNTEANVTNVLSFDLIKIDNSPYYHAKCEQSPKSWFIIDWDNVKSYDSLYDYDGIALSPSIFKNGGLSSMINDLAGMLENITATFSALDSAQFSTRNRVETAEENISKIIESEPDFSSSIVANQFQTSDKIGAPLYSSSNF